MTQSIGSPRILCLSAYEAASHRHWRQILEQGLAEFEWESLILPPRHFRWRIRGNPLSWLNEPLLSESYDLVLATSMVDLATLRGTQPALARTPAVAYFHENQFAYPDRRRDGQSNEPAIVNLYTALSADRVLFNSDWNRQSMLSGVARLMRRVPDRKPRDLVQCIEARSAVLPVPIDDDCFDGHDRQWSSVPHLVWNHRWEYDKGPERLLAILRALRDCGVEFRLSLVGQQFRVAPEPFSVIRSEFSEAIVQCGFIPIQDAYRQLLAEADIVLSTALHDFQGLAVLEAMAAGAVPVVPDRLAYPEYVPDELRYESHEQEPEQEATSAVRLICRLLARGRPNRRAFQPDHYRLSRLLPAYREALNGVLDAGPPTRKLVPE